MSEKQWEIFEICKTGRGVVRYVITPMKHVGERAAYYPKVEDHLAKDEYINGSTSFDQYNGVPVEIKP